MHKINVLNYLKISILLSYSNTCNAHILLLFRKLCVYGTDDLEMPVALANTSWCTSIHATSNWTAVLATFESLFTFISLSISPS